jgi:hypothetical protein
VKTDLEAGGRDFGPALGEAEGEVEKKEEARKREGVGAWRYTRVRYTRVRYTRVRYTRVRYTRVRYSLEATHCHTTSYTLHATHTYIPSASVFSVVRS